MRVLGGRSRRRRVTSVFAVAAISVVGLGLVPWAEAGAAPAPQAPAPQQVVGLSQGARGTSVRSLQQALLRAGIPVFGGADGVFGSATRSALITFQQREGLTQSGQVDAKTAQALGLATAAAPSGGTLVGLALGTRSEGVRVVQQALNDAGVYVPGGIDGIFGTGTKTAVSNFQRWNGLGVTGTVTAAVVKALGLRDGVGSTNSAASSPQGVAAAPAPVASVANEYVGMSQGARGAAVKRLQQALQAKGVAVPGGADGIFGPATENALRRYQQASGASANGKVSRQDAERLGLTTAAERSPATAPAAAANPYVGLKLGATGAKVKTLQAALLGAGISVRGGADGAFGLVTKNALIIYQRAHGLNASGVVDAATAAKLGLGVTAPAATATGTSGSGAYVGLRVGSRGDEVKALQRALLDTGLTVRGGADGVFGPATKAALIAFQSVNGIPRSGVVTAAGARILGLGTTTGPSGIVGVVGYPAFGEHSNRVAVLQRALLKAGISVAGGDDGHFGGATAGAVMSFQRREGLAVTGKVDAATARRLGVAASATPPPVSKKPIKISVFPVQGRCAFGDTWHAPRGGGRTHLGVDIIAKQGNLLYAVVDGEISKQYWDQPGSRAGNGVRLRQADGTYFTYLHLLDVAPGIKVGSKVKAGDVIGFVGSTGNSSTPHLHLEVHPLGGGAINPYPIVKAVDACNVTAPRS